MRKIFGLFTLLIFVQSFSQKKPDCSQLLSDLELYYKAEFREQAALTPEGRQKTLEQIKKSIDPCPSYTQKAYEWAEMMLIQIIEPINFGEEKNKWTQHLIAIYDQESQNFPNTRRENELKKITLAYNSRLFDDRQTQTALDKIYNQDPSIFPVELLTLYTTLIISDNVLKKDFSKPYIMKLDALNGITDYRIKLLEVEIQHVKSDSPKFRKNQTELKMLKTNSRNIFAELKKAKLDCSGWQALYEEDYEANQKNELWLANVLSRLDDYKCSKNNLFFEKAATQYYNLNSNAKAAFYMGEIALGKRDRSKAQEYFLKSATLEKNQTDKARLYYRLADLEKVSDKAKSREYVEKAIESKPDMLEGYILLSQLYAGAERSCFKSDFEAKAVFLLASQTIERLAEVDKKYETTVRKISKSYLEKAPTKQEIEKQKIQGKTIHFDCWIKRSVVIP